MSASLTSKLWRRERVSSWLEFQTTIAPFLNGEWLFRGVASVRHTLVPSVGRPREGFTYSVALEEALLDQFKREALPFLDHRPITEWEWLALAQHHGVPTRLLDWSESPSVSLFFAVWGNDHDDAGLYIVRRPSAVVALDCHPFKVRKVSFFYPGYVTPRLVSQRGLFTVHPKPDEPYRCGEMRQIVIDKSCKPDFRRKLDSSGIHHAAIFMDLDSLSRRLVALRTGWGGNGAAAPRASRDGAPSRRRAAAEPVRRFDPNDPNKGRFGGVPARDGLVLTARVKEIEADWYSIALAVAAAPRARTPLTGTVTFHLHDTFARPERPVRVRDGRATLEVCSYGAFTVGVVAGPGGTRLELDLADLDTAPLPFRER
ncbi:FRG domain-containing protein [Rhodoplanes azumiensis]|uniref:FRG domain-containing protein n=1 Tax=Rhodoplanes azumiensis TaxID=1897628 RepID=A0ABW5AH12_9BRAD